ncbi:MAG: acyl-CoA dehydrogenase family protein [Phycisphaerales bacterium]|nr:MAG: acyl-CoA dehydrogenase family protein [Phycisphaerales bacterium]
MNFELSDELVTLRDAVRKFAQEVIAPNARAWDRDGDIPDEVYGQLGELGLMGLAVPAELNGSGLSQLGSTVVIEEIARHCGATALMLCAHNGLCISHLLVAASDEQKRRYLPKLATGEHIGAWGLTETTCGSDAAALQTTAVADGNEWVINGNKMFITNGGKADLFVIMAVTDPGGERGRNISAFLVESGTKGLLVGNKEDKMGVRASNTVPLTFEDLRVPKGNLCGRLGEGYKDAMKVLNGGRASIAALSVGLGRGALEEALAYAQQRETFGKLLVEHQAVQFMLADMAVDVDAARLLVRRAATLRDAGESSRIEAAIAKLFASEMATRAALNAIQICGGYGYMKDMPVERYMRDAKLMEIGEGTSQIQRLVIARWLLDED